jgi:hypothetical protein
MLRHVALARTNVSEEHIASNIEVERIRELRTTLAVVLQLPVTAKVPNALFVSTLMMEATRYSELPVLTRATRRHVPEDGILNVP